MKRKYKVITNGDEIRLIVDGLSDDDAYKKMTCMREKEIEEFCDGDENDYIENYCDYWEVKTVDGM